MNDLKELAAGQKRYFDEGRTMPISSRKASLRTLRRMLDQDGELLAGAIGRDLGRCWLESWSAEPGLVLAEAAHALKRLGSWSRPNRQRSTPAMLPGSVMSRRIPFGTALIIGPWNYPAGLLLSPMVSALAAGNTVILKPSERAPETAMVLQEIIGSHFPPELVSVVRGRREETRWMIRNAADIVCFTGSIPTGRAVMAEAASRPVPVVLELGGVNPCFVDGDAVLRQAARRIAWGKFFGAGQTCLAPNHVLVEGSVEKAFLGEIRKAVSDFYGADPSVSPDYGRIIDEDAFDRLEPMLREGTPVTGGNGRRQDLYIAPTVLGGISRDSFLLKEEIFGPVLPVVSCDSIEEEIGKYGSGAESPLIAYGFSRNSRRMEGLLADSLRSGSITVNGTLHRIVSSSIGFGGVGQSGHGRYRGEEGFRQFTWEQVILRKNPRFEMPRMYPPYRIGRRFVKMLSRFF